MYKPFDAEREKRWKSEATIMNNGKRCGMMERISIIVPVYNLENYIRRTVESICNQSYRNLEIILVDDGSQDSSPAILDELQEQDTRIRVIHKKNGGVTRARLVGVEAATGEWIGFVDGDDEIETQMYERLLDNAIKYDAQISHCGYQMVFSDGRVNYFYNTGCLAVQDRITALKELLSGARIEPSLCNKLFRKTLFHSLLHTKVIDTSIKIYEDLLMNFYLFKESDKSVYEDVCPYHYLVRYSSSSRQKYNYNLIFDPIKVKQIILQDVTQNLKNEAMATYLSTCIGMYSGLVAENEAQYKCEITEIRRFILAEKDSAKFLNKKQQILFVMIQYVPHLYPAIYRTYSKYFQKKRYT